ncbi:SIS domain-containing protein [Phytoactinopolyspora alkaliphila]|uniref:SIS domain-containing protein n=1 Tax=Phytoactinopolyspora alkaliphila TaxID=1783498 RepID=A0A6N9YLZ8_9ACTN|nr:SIS domain-containing protein [Phytoactinopolyspora alkaliphila]NED95940.1 SIS domain-containing protein [Phytoactinopolyspora alkaliphila]
MAENIPDHRLASAVREAGIEQQVDEHVRTAQAIPALLPAVRAVGELLCDRFAAGGTLYTFGNGGSAADAQHFTGELIGHYKRDRRPLPAVTLTTDPTVSTCIANDYSFDDVFARQVDALVRPGDVVSAFTTSGRSANIVAGLAAARKRGATTVLFGGGDGGPAREHADHVLLAPSTTTARIQEMHTLMLHLISEIADVWAAEEDPAP